MIWKDSMAIPQMLCRAGLTTDYSVLAGDFEDTMKI
jgi:hypothetical protein